MLSKHYICMMLKRQVEEGVVLVVGQADTHIGLRARRVPDAERSSCGD